ncbi:unnamed protein product [Brassica napus]|uniref:(rape) hypothetical protein n=1 Tax=Brassica napus TaxID=3708 RepID=A0A816WFX0_BRANA|nr:unnamed protein product [Brassica napus]
MSESDEDVVDLPRFFKVFLPETASESMAIPKSFNEHLQDPLPHETAKLQGIGGGVWTVSFKKIRGGAYFTSGWSKFAEDHELKHGEFLTFVYDGSHTFEVSVFGRSELVAADSNEGDDPSFHAGEDDEVSQSINPVDSDDTVSVAEGFPNLEVESNPCFTTILKKRIYDLLIPADVVKEHGLTFCDRIKYIDGEGILDGVRVNCSYYGISFKGWGRICRRNRLKENDTVHCEMLHKEESSFNQDHNHSWLNHSSSLSVHHHTLHQSLIHYHEFYCFLFVLGVW